MKLMTLIGFSLLLVSCSSVYKEKSRSFASYDEDRDDSINLIEKASGGPYCLDDVGFGSSPVCLLSDGNEITAVMVGHTEGYEPLELKWCAKPKDSGYDGDGDLQMEFSPIKTKNGLNRMVIQKKQGRHGFYISISDQHYSLSTARDFSIRNNQDFTEFFNNHKKRCK